MAAVMSDYQESSRFHHSHTMIAGSGRERSPDASYSQRSRPRSDHASSSSSHHPSQGAGTPPLSANPSAIYKEGLGNGSENRSSGRGGPPSPPSSSSPNMESWPRRQFTSQENLPDSSAPYSRSPRIGSTHGDMPLRSPEPFSRSSRSLDDVKKYGGHTIKVRDLAHIQSFATEDFLSYRGQSGRRRTADDPTLKYEISGMPITDIIEMVAGLLTKITTTNDKQHESLHRPMSTGDTVNLTGHSSSVLAFHGKNVPSITILSYLARIHKYCPTTYEVFLSLLVYFDRMTERVNAAPMEALRRDSMEQDQEDTQTSYSADGSDLADSPPVSASRNAPEIMDDLQSAQYSHGPSEGNPAFPLSHFFVVDSFNIHRLVIAGVTCASKFFSDVFYTNSRYAKVCFSLTLIERAIT